MAPSKVELVVRTEPCVCLASLRSTHHSLFPPVLQHVALALVQAVLFPSPGSVSPSRLHLFSTLHPLTSHHPKTSPPFSPYPTPHR